MSTTYPPIFPLWLRCVLATSIVASVVATGWFTRVSDPLPRAHEIERGEVLRSTHLYFRSSDNGQVVVEDAKNQTTLVLMPNGDNEFMRSVMRGFVIQRKASGFDNTVPFELTSWESGFLSLNDPVTGRLIELNAFGQDNASAFKKLLANQES